MRMRDCMGRLGIIGGTGLLAIEGLEVHARREDETRWGMPSGPVLEGVLAGCKVAFLQRHGTPSRDDPALAGRVIPYLKDLWEQA